MLEPYICTKKRNTGTTDAGSIPETDNSDNCKHMHIPIAFPSSLVDPVKILKYKM